MQDIEPQCGFVYLANDTTEDAERTVGDGAVGDGHICFAARHEEDENVLFVFKQIILAQQLGEIDRLGQFHAFGDFYFQCVIPVVIDAGAVPKVLDQLLHYSLTLNL